MSGNLARQLLRELGRASTRTWKEARTGPVWQRVKSEMRNGGGKVPLDKKEKLLKEYLCYVSSSAKHRELLAEYQGRGERSVEDTAGIVGMKLPQKPN